MTEVIYKVFYHTPVEEIENQIEETIKKEINKVLKVDARITGWHVIRFNPSKRK